MKSCHLLKAIFVATVSLLTSACQTDTAYYTYLPIPNDGWEKTDTLEFLIPDSLSGQTYELGIGIRHREKYQYRDIWLELTQSLPVRDSLQTKWIEKRDTFHIYLADEKGKWNSSGTTGGFYQLLTPCSTITLPSYKEAFEMQEESSSMSSDGMPEEGNEIVAQKPTRKKKYTYLGTEVSVAEKSMYKLKLTHIMSDSVLLHITDVGIHLTNPKEK